MIRIVTVHTNTTIEDVVRMIEATTLGRVSAIVRSSNEIKVWIEYPEPPTRFVKVRLPHNVASRLMDNDEVNWSGLESTDIHEFGVDFTVACGSIIEDVLWSQDGSEQVG